MGYLLFLVFALTLTGSAAFASAHGPTHPAIAFDLPGDSLVIPMKRVDGRIIVDVMLDGKGPFPFIFDTGAMGSVMDRPFAREQGLKMGRDIMVGSPGGKGVPGNQVTIENLGIGGLTLKNVTSVAFDGLPFPRNATSPRGVLGPYGLNGLLITLDYPGERIVFRRGSLPKPDGRDVFGYDRNQGLPEIPATVANEPIVLHLDSGASGGLSLPIGFAERLPLLGPLVDRGFAKTVDQVDPMLGADLKGDFVIGRYTLQNPALEFVDRGKRVGNLGAAILSEFAITIDPANARLRLDGPASGRLEVTVAQKPRYGVQLEALEANPLTVRVVDAGSAAEKGGLRAGDQIVRMNGRPVVELTVDDRLSALKNSPLKVTVKRGGAALELAMMLN